MPRSREPVLGVRAEAPRRSSAPRAKRRAIAAAEPPLPPPPEPAPRDKVLGSSSNETSAALADDADTDFGTFAHAVLDGGAGAAHSLLDDDESVLGGFGLLDKGYASVFGEDTQEVACGAGSVRPTPLSDVACDVAGADVALNDALSFVAEVKSRFQREPRTYRAFLELLARYRADEAGALETHAAVARLFRRQPDLAAAFGRFLPADVAPQPAQLRGAR